MIEEGPFVPMRQRRISRYDDIRGSDACADAGQQDGIGKEDGEAGIGIRSVGAEPAVIQIDIA